MAAIRAKLSQSIHPIDLSTGGVATGTSTEHLNRLGNALWLDSRFASYDERRPVAQYECLMEGLREVNTDRESARF